MLEPIWVLAILLATAPVAGWAAARLAQTHAAALSSFRTMTLGGSLVFALLLSWAAMVAPRPVWGVMLPTSALLAWTLSTLAWIDARRLILPNGLTLPLIAAGLVVAMLLPVARIEAHLLGAALGYGAFALIGEVYFRLRGREGLGLGDAKLFAAGGAWLGWTGLPGVLLIAASTAVFYALARRVSGAPETPTPFGPFLALGIWLTWLYGPLVLAF